MLDYTTVFSSFFSTMQKTGDLVLQKKRHNMLKKEKPKVKKKIIFDEEMRHQAEYENKGMSFEKDNRLLKQSLRQLRNQSLVRRSCTNSGFIKSTDHRPTNHQPTDQRPVTHQPTDQPTTNRSIHQPNNHQANQQDSILKT